MTRDIEVLNNRNELILITFVFQIQISKTHNFYNQLYFCYIYNNNYNYTITIGILNPGLEGA